ncbi:mechanosensitive ion channel [Palleronia sediminis]|uniref:Mechanosensitive ion channel n=1 Tax=Palleronia sediminis TaxID=2547833 RepID=A0A4R6AEW6_9RHOB|nr:mechanosensitive ion channel domain-containing protein [Palleronia sediminis]TDL81504.1 mechanosensitive ion channel [Palleronia sediminis]
MTAIIRLVAAFLLAASFVPAVQAQSLFPGQDAPAETTSPQEERSAVDLLIDVISDDAARAELIERLSAAQDASEAATLAPEDAAADEDDSFGRRIATVTQDLAATITDDIATFWARLAAAPNTFAGLSSLSPGAFISAVSDLLIIFVVTVGVFIALRSRAKIRFRRFGAEADGAPVAKAIGLYFASAALDLATVLCAWVIGYVLAATLLGGYGSVGIRQSLYLNAFLVVETLKVGLRMVLSPSTRCLRPLPIGDRAARYLSTRIGLIVSIVGYGSLLIVPIVNRQASYAAGRAVTAVLALTVLALALWMVLRHRRDVTRWLIGEDRGIKRRGSVRFLARNWHWPVLIYLLGIFAVALAGPSRAIFSTLFTSGQVILTIVAGIAVAGLLTGWMKRGIALPDALTQRIPLLQSRVNKFVPAVLFVIRTIIVIFVVAVALDALGFFDLREILAGDLGLRLTGTTITVVLVLIVAFAIWLALTSYVEYRLNPAYGQIATPRENTLLTLARNAGTIALVVVTLMIVLAEIGLNIAPLLASAGVLGLAIGFGAQKLVQDIITGLFIQFENAINVGDVISAGTATGVVERLTIRSVSIRDVSGVYHIIPFSSVDMVSNFMRDFSYALIDMGIAYREDVADAKRAMHDAFDELRADPEKGALILDDMEWFGVDAFADSAVICRVRIKTVAGQQWAITRAYNEILKRIFDARGIEIPFPHQTIYLGERKDGSTQTFHLTRDDKDAAAE